MLAHHAVQNFGVKQFRFRACRPLWGGQSDFMLVWCANDIEDVYGYTSTAGDAEMFFKDFSILCCRA